MDTESRRLELLKLEGLDFSQTEIVKELTVKYSCSRRTVYSDFENRESWQLSVQSVIAGANLLDSENVKEAITKQQWKNGSETP